MNIFTLLYIFVMPVGLIKPPEIQ